MSNTIGSDVISDDNVAIQPVYSPGAAVTAYTFLAHTDFILDELCAIRTCPFTWESSFHLFGLTQYDH